LTGCRRLRAAKAHWAVCLSLATLMGAIEEEESLICFFYRKEWGSAVD